MDHSNNNNDSLGSLGLLIKNRVFRSERLHAPRSIRRVRFDSNNDSVRGGLNVNTGINDLQRAVLPLSQKKAPFISHAIGSAKLAEEAAPLNSLRNTPQDLKSLPEGCRQPENLQSFKFFEKICRVEKRYLAWPITKK